MVRNKGGEAVGFAGTWALRSLVVSTSMVSVWHIAPIVWDSSASSTIGLASNPNAYFAREGIRRLSRQARWGPSRRKLLLKHGAISTLARASAHPDEKIRDAALGALASFSYHVHDARVSPNRDARVPPARLVGFKGIAEALVADDCGSGCQRLWTMFLHPEAQRNADSRNERVGQLLVVLRDADANRAGIEEDSVITSTQVT